MADISEADKANLVISVSKPLCSCYRKSFQLRCEVSKLFHYRKQKHSQSIGKGRISPRVSNIASRLY